MVFAGAAVLIATRGTAATGRLTALQLAPGGVRRISTRRPATVGAICMVLAVVALGLMAGQLLASALVTAAFIAAVVHRRRGDHRSQIAARAAVPEACRVLAAELRAGSLPADALIAAADISPPRLATAWTAAAAADRLGASVAEVLAAPPDGCEALGALAACWRISAGTGAGLAHTAERLADVFAADLEARAVVDAELAGARLSAVVMACLPVFGLALGAALGAEPLAFLSGTPPGRICLVAAVALDLVGLAWVRRLGLRAAR